METIKKQIGSKNNLMAIYMIAETEIQKMLIKTGKAKNSNKRIEEIDTMLIQIFDSKNSSITCGKIFFQGNTLEERLIDTIDRGVMASGTLNSVCSYLSIPSDGNNEDRANRIVEKLFDSEDSEDTVDAQSE